MWEKLLDPDIPIDLKLLDEAATLMYRGQPNDEIIQIIEQVTQREDFFSCIDKIIELNYSRYLKSLALIVFKDFVQNNWGDLPKEDSNYYKNFIAQFIMKPFNEDEKELLNIADTVLICILLYEWPDEWPNFIENILSVALNSPELCQNCLKVIRMLVEEFTDFSENSMTTIRQAEMHFAFSNQFDSIFPILLDALSSGNDGLIIEALNSMKIFLNVIESDKIFAPEIIEALVNDFLPNPKYMIFCISIISLIPSHHTIFDENADSFIPLFYAIVSCLGNIFVNESMYDIDISPEIKPVYFLHIFINSMTKLLQPFIFNIPTVEKSDQFSICLKWLLDITCQIVEIDPDNSEDFQDLVDFWHLLTRIIYFDLNSDHETIIVYYPFLSYLFRFYLSSMVEPTINNTRVDEDGIHYHRYDLTQEANTYNYMRETLIFMYHINPDDSLEAILEKLEEIKSEPTIESVNSFSWAIGAIPGTISDLQELKVISEILQTFMSMVASISGEENSEDKACLTCAILHICSQYGLMLSKHYDLLKIILNKMIEFSQEPYQPIQDAAIQALTQIGRYSTNALATKQQNESQSFLEMLLCNIPQILNPLSTDNVIAMIEFFSFLITSVKTEKAKLEMTSAISDIINERLQELCQSVDFDSPDWCNNFIFIVDCNAQIITYLYSTYSKCFIEIYQCFIQIYQETAERLNFLADFPDTQPYNLLKKLKAAIIHLFISFVNSSSREEDLNLIAENPLINVFLADFVESPVKTTEIIGLISATCLKPIMSDFFQTNYNLIMESIVESSLPYMENPGDFPEIWPEFNKFLSMYFQNYSSLTYSGDSLLSMFNLLKKACAHPVQKVSDYAMMTLSSLISNIEFSQSQARLEFFNMISIDTFIFITSLLIDGIHKYLFSNIMNLMRKLIQMDQVRSRAGELMDGLCELLPNRQPREIHDLILQMIELSNSKYSQFKDLIRDFVVMAKKYAPGDPALYQEELLKHKKQLEEEYKKNDQSLDSRAPENQEVAENLAAAFCNFSIQPD